MSLHVTGIEVADWGVLPVSGQRFATTTTGLFEAFSQVRSTLILYNSRALPFPPWSSGEHRKRFSSIHSSCVV